MGVGVNKSREYDIVGAIDLLGVLRKGMLADFIRRADSDDLAVCDQHGAIVEDAQLAHGCAAARGSFAAQSQELRCMGEEYGPGFDRFLVLIVQ